MNIYEHFQDNESSLNSAYNSASLNESSQNIPYCDEEIVLETPETTAVIQDTPIEKSTISNLWDFLGLSKLPKEDKGCLFDCSIHGARCLERCKYKNPKKCKYRCLKKGLYCSKQCLIKPEPTIQTCKSKNNSNNTNRNNANANANGNNANGNNANANANHGNNANGNNVNANGNNANANANGNANGNNANHDNHNHNHGSNNANHGGNNANHGSNNANHGNDPIGNKSDFMGYAPYNSRLWPSHTQAGWDLNKIDNYHSEDYIEVLVPRHHEFSEEGGATSLLF